MKIIVDLFGTDDGPESSCRGVMKALKKYDFCPVLVGENELIKKIAQEEGVASSSYEILEADHGISNLDDPAISIRRDKEASQVKGLKKLNEEDMDAFLSGGSTGALLAGSLFITKRIKGVLRAPISTAIPSKDSKFIFLDLGANVDTTPEMLCQFGIMGSTYAKVLLKNENPRVGLLNIGTEPGKGDKRTKEAYQLLEKANINFIGNVEARDLLYSVCDVVVADGFNGNIYLKTLEGALSFLKGIMKDTIYKNARTKMGGLLLKPALKENLSQFKVDDIAAAPLLGVNKPVFKMHGNSNSDQVVVAIGNVIEYVEKDVTSQIKEQLKYIDND